MSIEGEILLSVSSPTFVDEINKNGCNPEFSFCCELYIRDRNRRQSFIKRVIKVLDTDEKEQSVLYKASQKHEM